MVYRMVEWTEQNMALLEINFSPAQHCAALLQGKHVSPLLPAHPPLLLLLPAAASAPLPSFATLSSNNLAWARAETRLSCLLTWPVSAASAASLLTLS